MIKKYITNSNVKFFFLWPSTQKYCIICYQQVHCTQCKASSNIANFSLPLMIKWQVLHFYTSEDKLLSGTVFLDVKIFIWLWYAFHDNSLHIILFVQTFIKYQRHVHTLLSVKEECCLLKISTWILHFKCCKNELWKLQWRDLHSFCCDQQNPISRQFKPLQFISKGNKLSM